MEIASWCALWKSDKVSSSCFISSYLYIHVYSDKVSSSCFVSSYLYIYIYWPFLMVIMRFFFVLTHSFMSTVAGISLGRFSMWFPKENLSRLTPVTVYSLTISFLFTPPPHIVYSIIINIIYFWYVVWGLSFLTAHSPPIKSMRRNEK